MSEAQSKAIRSPSWPGMSLCDAVDAVRKIEGQYRASIIARENAAKLLGYAPGSGGANKALAALASYGLLERAGKGEARVSERARAILHAANDEERRQNLLSAAMEPDLFREIREKFAGVPIPPEDGVVTYLNRQGFNPTAVRPAAKAFLQTIEYIEQLGASESHRNDPLGGADSPPPNVGAASKKTYGGAKVGDLIQWESQGALQFPQPLRVRWISDDGQWLAVEGSDTGIRMSEAIVDTRVAAPPIPPAAHSPADLKPKVEAEDGFEEWFRAKVGASKQVQILYRGEGDIGAKEIQKLIDILTAQKAALDE
ncbi:hypothetical protein [Methylocystis sp.]|uniref:hypothetical protein n=1 Tax=Methylocystis sp. TaxID=1911079 RepID=UPI0025ECB095|nr:hypothetical protein [Methylocystis sp.]